uniref:Uncharacterized protein n=1 Tax=Arundo donax TaxID=35708 RepID=A0A0A9CHE4_ARUDO
MNQTQAYIKYSDVSIFVVPKQKSPCTANKLNNNGNLTYKRDTK